MSILRAFNIARSGLQVQEKNLSVKAQNLAAQGADSYKKQYMVVHDLPYADDGAVGSFSSSAGTVTPTGAQIGLGVKVGGIYRSFQQGDLLQTDNALDLAIEGQGFYKINMPDGSVAYTRVAAFQQNPQGLLETITGYTLSPNITIPPNATGIKVNEDGQVMVEIQGQVGYTNIGQIELATFTNPTGLKSIGDSLYLETTASGAPESGIPGKDQRGRIRQGMREGSNVSSVEEITDMIKMQQTFEAITKVIKTGESMMASGNSVGRS